MKLQNEITLKESKLANGNPPTIKCNKGQNLLQKQDCGENKRSQKYADRIDGLNENVVKKANRVGKKNHSTNSEYHQAMRTEDIVRPKTPRKSKVPQADIARLKTAYDRLVIRVQKLNARSTVEMNESVENLNAMLEKLNKKGTQNLETLQSFFQGVKSLWYTYKQVKILTRQNREKTKIARPSAVHTSKTRPTDNQKGKMNVSSENTNNGNKMAEWQRPSKICYANKSLSEIRNELVSAIDVINDVESQRVASNKKHLPPIERKKSPTYTKPDQSQRYMDKDYRENTKKVQKQSEQVPKGKLQVEIDVDITPIKDKGNFATFKNEEELKSLDKRGKTKQSLNSRNQMSVQFLEGRNHQEKIIGQTNFHSDGSLPPIPTARHNPNQSRDVGKKFHDCSPDDFYEELSYQMLLTESTPNHSRMSYETRYINDPNFTHRIFQPSSSCSDEEIDLFNLPLDQKCSNFSSPKCPVHGKEQVVKTFWNKPIGNMASERYRWENRKTMWDMAVQTSTSEISSKSERFVQTVENPENENASKMRKCEAPPKHLQASDVVVLIDIPQNKKQMRKCTNRKNLRTKPHNSSEKYVYKNSENQNFLETSGKEQSKIGLRENPIGPFMEINERKDGNGFSDQHGTQGNKNLGLSISRPTFDFKSQSFAAIRTPEDDIMESRKVRSEFDIGKHATMLSNEKKFRFLISLPPKNICSFHVHDQGGDANNSIKCGHLHVIPKQSVSNKEDERKCDPYGLSLPASSASLSPLPKRRKLANPSIGNCLYQSISPNKIMTEILHSDVVRNLTDNIKKGKLDETQNLLTSPPCSSMCSPVPKRRKLTAIERKAESQRQNLLTSSPCSSLCSPVPKRRILAEIGKLESKKCSSDKTSYNNKDNTPHPKPIGQLVWPLFINGLGEAELLIYYSKPDEILANHQLTEKEFEMRKTVTACIDVMKYTFVSNFSAPEKLSEADQTRTF